MKVVYTAAAQNDLREIGAWLAAHYPTVAARVERRIRDVVAHCARWPESASRASGREAARRAVGPLSVQDFLGSLLTR